MAETQSGNRRPTRQAASRYYIPRTVRILDEDIKRVADNTISVTLRSIYRAEAKIPKLGTKEVAEQVVEHIRGLIDATAMKVDAESQRMDQIIEAAGLGGMPGGYTGKHDFMVEISSPLSAAFVDLIEKSDKLLPKIHLLWIAGKLDITQHVDGARQYAREITNLSRTIAKFQEETEERLKNSKGRGRNPDAMSEAEAADDGKAQNTPTQDPDATTPAADKPTKGKKAARKSSAKSDEGTESGDDGVTHITADEIEAESSSHA